MYYTGPEKCGIHEWLNCTMNLKLVLIPKVSVLTWYKLLWFFWCWYGYITVCCVTSFLSFFLLFKHFTFLHLPQKLCLAFIHTFVTFVVQSCSHGLQHDRLPYPSPSPGACSNSRPLSWWCHPTISSSVIPFSSCFQSSPAAGSFPTSQLCASGSQSIGASVSASVLPMNIQDLFPITYILHSLWLSWNN